MEKVLIERDRILKLLAGKLNGLYLAGGTALSSFYFHHRESYDLDFFTKEFSRPKVEKIISDLAEVAGRKIELVREEDRKDRARVMIYHLLLGEADLLKIDFVEDVYDLIKPTKIIDGIPVLSIEDIYIRKIFAACGSHRTSDLTGREVFASGRQTVRDFFDLYFLSITFRPLSKFAFEFFSAPQRESIVVWYRTYSRSSMQHDILDIVTDKKVCFRDMDNHFKHEVDQIIKKEFE